MLLLVVELLEELVEALALASVFEAALAPLESFDCDEADVAADEAESLAVEAWSLADACADDASCAEELEALEPAEALEADD